jgi:hypothetical protein
MFHDAVKRDVCFSMVLTWNIPEDVCFLVVMT